MTAMIARWSRRVWWEQHITGCHGSTFERCLRPTCWLTARIEWVLDRLDYDWEPME